MATAQGPTDMPLIRHHDNSFQFLFLLVLAYMPRGSKLMRRAHSEIHGRCPCTRTSKQQSLKARFMCALNTTPPKRSETDTHVTNTMGRTCSAFSFPVPDPMTNPQDEAPGAGPQSLSNLPNPYTSPRPLPKKGPTCRRSTLPGLLIKWVFSAINYTFAWPHVHIPTSIFVGPVASSTTNILPKSINIAMG